MSGSISIGLAEDHHIVRQALRSLLETEPGFRVIGEAADGLAAVELARTLRPDVLLVDLSMPRLGGMEVLREVRRLRLPTRLLVLSMSLDEAHAIEALDSGALGYVRKDATAGDLMRAVREVALGALYVSPPFTLQTLQAYRRLAAEAGADPLATLTRRERQVLRLAAEGLRRREIAEQLGISPRTAETHHMRVMRKLGFHRPADLVRYALRRGIVPLEDPDLEDPAGDA